MRADLLMDVGDSLNVAIDIGQVEGAFVQGMGRWTMEEIRFDERGAMTTVDPHTYHIPTAADVPRDFRVTLLGAASSPTSVHSSKVRPRSQETCSERRLARPSPPFTSFTLFTPFTSFTSFIPFTPFTPLTPFTSFMDRPQAVGEPPFFLSASVYFALKAAVHAARAEGGHGGHLRLDAPLTAGKVRLACRDGLVNP